MALLVPPPIKRVAVNHKRKGQGIAFLLFIVVFFAFVVAMYNQAFQKTVPVSLRTDRIGNQLSLNADVKFRGVNVGKVKSMSTNGEIATIKMAILPDQIKLIPANVQARILPKTLFGQKYVDLVSPDNTGPQKVALGASAQVASLKKGDVIPQDRSSTAIEIEQLYDNLLPFLTTVQPEKLNQTLSAIATALDGRGEELGDNLSRLDDYLRQINQHLPSIQDDVSELADYSQILDKAVPDLMRFLGDNVVTSQTIVQKQRTLFALLTGTADAADTSSAVLAENRNRLIQAPQLGEDITRTIARRADNLAPIINGLTGLVPKVHEVFGTGSNKNWLHISLTILGNKGAYQRPQDCPKNLSPEGNQYGPNCGGGGAQSGASVGDGTASVLATDPLSLPTTGTEPSVTSDATTTSGAMGASAADDSALIGSGETPVDLTVSSVGSPEEKAMIEQIVGSVNTEQAATHDRSPDLATLFLGPMFRGTEVSFK